MSFLKRNEKRNGRYENAVPTDLGGFSMMLKLIPEYLLNRAELEPKKPLGPFATDVRLYDVAPASGLRITWFGHSAMLLEMDGARVLIGTVWEERASPVQFMGPKRFFPPTMKLDEMPEIDVVLLSHDHYDHMGAATLKKLAGMAQTQGALWVTSEGVDARLLKLGVPRERLRGLNWTESVSAPGGLTLTAAPARHFSGRGTRDRMGTLWSSWVISGAEHRVYFGADSGTWSAFGEICAAYGPFDVTMLEIGAWNERWGTIHLGPDGAADAYEQMRRVGEPGLLFPIHWGLFNLALHAWRQPITRMREVALAQGIPLWMPEPGVPLEVEAGVERYSDWYK